jgi:hypothetical protein
MFRPTLYSISKASAPRTMLTYPMMVAGYTKQDCDILGAVNWWQQGRGQRRPL